MGKNIDKSSDSRLKELRRILNGRAGTDSAQIENFLKNPQEADWKQFAQYFGQQTLDTIKKLYPEYFKQAKSDESQLDENGKKKTGGSCSGNSSQQDPSSDNPQNNNQEKDNNEEQNQENQEEQNQDEQQEENQNEEENEEDENEDEEEDEEEEEEEEDEDEEDEEDEEDDSFDEYEEYGDVDANQLDDSINEDTDKSYTVFKAIPPEWDGCPVAYRDDVADQFTPQDDLITMEKTVRDFLKLQGKIYDPESTNPKFFASEDWVQKFEKDKNVVLALMDQYKANAIRMEHLYNEIDDKSQEKLCSIDNQNCSSSFKVNILWTSRALKEWSNNWFIYGGCDSKTKLYDKDYWVPGLTGQMMEWMKLGTYEEFNMRPIANETIIRKIDLLEAVIDRLVNAEAVQNAISKYMNLKEELEQDTDQKKDRVFTPKVIDSQMGKKLGVTDTGTTNEKVENTRFIEIKYDETEYTFLFEQMSEVKAVFQSLREQALDNMKESRKVNNQSSSDYPNIWTQIDTLATPVYDDLCIMNELIEDMYNDHETPGKHCSVTHEKLCPTKLQNRITAFRCIIQQGVVDVMTNQAMLPQEGLNILDSMFNQLWEYGERGPLIEFPSWCQNAIDSINQFERSLMDAWSEVFDCWEREFITRLWRISLDHHSSNWERTQTKYVKTIHNHVHPVVLLAQMTTASIGGDSVNFDSSPLKGIFTCPGHLEKLLKQVCVHYRIYNISHLARHFRADVKALCQWMVSAIEAVGIKLSAISAVMSDPTLNGNDSNMSSLSTINDLREKNHLIRNQIEKAYCIYQDVTNMKNKKEYDEEIAHQELQPNKYSNEDQLNMTSSVQSESIENNLTSRIYPSEIDIKELKPWDDITLSDNKVDAKEIPVKCACNKFGKIIETLAGFETLMNIENGNSDGNGNGENNNGSETTGVGKKVGGKVGEYVGGYVGEYAGSAVGGYFGGPVGAAVGGAVGEYVGSKVGEQVGEQVGDKAEGMANEIANDNSKNNSQYEDLDPTYKQDNEYMNFSNPSSSSSDDERLRLAQSWVDNELPKLLNERSTSQK